MAKQNTRAYLGRPNRLANGVVQQLGNGHGVLLLPQRQTKSSARIKLGQLRNRRTLGDIAEIVIIYASSSRPRIELESSGFFWLFAPMLSRAASAILPH